MARTGHGAYRADQAGGSTRQDGGLGHLHSGEETQPGQALGPLHHRSKLQLHSVHEEQSSQILTLILLETQWPS